MSQIQTLVDTLNTYKALPHHTNPTLKTALSQIQAWQKGRLRRTHEALFADDKTAPLTNYLIDKIYGDEEFDTLADQLLTAGQNALSGSGKLEKLIPENALGAGVLGVQSAVEAVKLDLALAQIHHDHHHSKPIDEALMATLYQTANAKEARLAQIQQIAEVCQRSDKYFNSFILQNAFKLAKNMAYDNGYQPLYDFIGEGLFAMKPLKKIEDFITPFVSAETALIHHIHEQETP